jgi:hypothetical protein
VARAAVTATAIGHLRALACQGVALFCSLKWLTLDPQLHGFNSLD